MTDPGDPARRYVRRTMVFMGAYAALNLAAVSGAFDDLKPPGTWAFALAAAAPVLGHIASLLAYMRDADEFVRALMGRRLIVATGLSTAIVSAWGLMEVYAQAPHFPAVLFYPLLWASFGAAMPFVRGTR